MDKSQERRKSSSGSFFEEQRAGSDEMIIDIENSGQVGAMAEAVEHSRLLASRIPGKATKQERKSSPMPG